MVADRCWKEVKDRMESEPTFFNHQHKGNNSNKSLVLSSPLTQLKQSHPSVSILPPSFLGFTPFPNHPTHIMLSSRAHP